MGKLEKVIVLSVLAVIAVILVLSLTLDDPLKKDKVVMAGGSPTQPGGAGTPAKLSPEGRPEQSSVGATQAPTAAPSLVQQKVEPQVQPQAKSADLVQAVPVSQPAASAKSAGSAPSTLLSTNVALPKPDAGAAHASQATGTPSGSILKSSDGLQESYLADMRFYTWQSGDSFRSVAAKYYGDPAKFTILRRSNEGRENVQAGEKILVPVFDLDAPRPVDAALASPAAAKSGTQAKAPTKAVDAAGGPRVHVVQDGESLWKIAKLELGDGGRWNEIYEANRDVLSKPEAVHVGLKLRIPVK